MRARGVMEKCTYCVQRISRARRLAERETRLIADGEVVTACQPACPTTAIQFGNLLDPNSAVAKLRRAQDHYALLADLNTRPRTTYLAQAPQSERRPRRRDMTVASALERAPALAEAAAVLSRTIDDRAITDLVCAPLMRSAGKGWWIAFLVCVGGNAGDALRRLHALQRRHRHLRQQHQRRLGLPDRELRLVDRPRQRRHADLRRCSC